MTVDQYIGDKLEVFLRDQLRYPSERTHRNQLSVFINALAIFNHRQAERGDLWAQFDAHDSFHHARDCFARIGHILGQIDHENPLTPEKRTALNNACLDGINYLAFTYRHVNGGGWVPDVSKSDI